MNLGSRSIGQFAEPSFQKPPLRSCRVKPSVRWDEARASVVLPSCGTGPPGCVSEMVVPQIAACQDGEPPPPSP